MRALTSTEIPVIPAGPVSLKESNLGISPEFGNILTHWNDAFFMLLAPIDDYRESAQHQGKVLYAKNTTDIPQSITLRLLGVSSEEEAARFTQASKYTTLKTPYVSLAHDQTHKYIGQSPDHRVMGVFPATIEGLRDIASISGRNTIQLIVLK
jgi:hypothetical protein